MTPRLCASGGSSTCVAAATGPSEVLFYQHSVSIPSLQASSVKLHVSVHQRRLHSPPPRQRDRR